MVNTLRTIKCPACQKEMVKVFIPSRGIHLDICLNGCGGIYFDNREFSYFDEQHEDIPDIEKELEGKKFIKVDESLPRSCPVCGANMVKNFSSLKREIKVDDCYSCGGKFLDYGELQKIRNEFKDDNERIDHTMEVLRGTVGVELKALEAETERLRNERSFFKKLFDKYVIGL